MSVSQIASWLTPGCGPDCRPRDHDPLQHERYGYQQGVESRHPRIVSVGCLTIDLTTECVTVDGARVPLTPTEYRIVHHLAINVGRWCRTADIEAGIWGHPGYNANNRPGHNVRVNMHRLRPKLGPAGALIEACTAGRGYLLRHSQRDQFSLPVRGAS